MAETYVCHNPLIRYMKNSIFTFLKLSTKQLCIKSEMKLFCINFTTPGPWVTGYCLYFHQNLCYIYMVSRAGKRWKKEHSPCEWQDLHSHSFPSHSCCLLLLALAPGAWHWFLAEWLDLTPLLSPFSTPPTSLHGTVLFTVLADHFL